MDKKPKVEVWLHGTPARSLEQIMKYLSGDAHDRSKVQIFVSTGDPKTSFFADFPFTEA